MGKLSLKVAVPMILAGVFSISVFFALNYDNLRLNFFIIMLLLTVYIFFFGFSTGQNLASPVKKLLERANELSKGNFESRVYIENKDEIGELARLFNEIAQKLEESHSETKLAENTVDIKVRARTQALEETIDALEQKVKNRTIELERLMNDSSKFSQQVKAKEAEVNQLRKETESLKARVAKYKPIK